MRVSGITIPDHKRLDISLTAVYGIGRPLAAKILNSVGIPGETRAKDLKAEDEAKLRKALEPIKIEGDLKREVAGNIKRLKDIKSYRGGRHTKRLPCRGQTTKVNSRTVRGNARKTMGSGRTKVDKK